MDELKEAPAVHLNFPLLVFSLYRTFKSGIAAAGEPIPWNRGGLVNVVIIQSSTISNNNPIPKVWASKGRQSQKLCLCRGKIFMQGNSVYTGISF